MIIVIDYFLCYQRRGYKKMRYVVNLSSILCTVLLLATLLYVGRGVYAIFIIVAILSRKYSSQSMRLFSLLAMFIIIHETVFVFKQMDVLRIINVFIIYIPLVLYVFRKYLIPSGEILTSILIALSLLINGNFLLQYIRFGYIRGGVLFLGASINYFAAINSLFLCYFLYIISKKGSRKLSIYLATCISIASIFISLSRVCIAVSVIMLFAYAIKNLIGSCQKYVASNLIRYLFRILFLVGFLCVIFVYLYKSSSNFQNSVESIIYYFKRIQTVRIGSSREVLWGNAWEIIRSNPLFGTGTPLVNDNTMNLAAPHNFVLEILLMVGFVGFAIYLGFYFPIYARIIKSCERSNRFYIFLIMITYYMINLVQPFISTSYFYNTLFGIMILSLKENYNYGNEHD